jgi:hypothetical protein
LPQTVGVPTDSIVPPFTSSPTYTEYQSTAKGKRGFCSKCGSSLTFLYIEKPQHTEIHLGTIDEDVLLGEKGGDEYHARYGTKSTRKEGGLGSLLSRTDRSGHIWFENAIEGVTDNVPGLKWFRERTDGEGFEREEEIREGSPELLEKRASIAEKKE